MAKWPKKVKHRNKVMAKIYGPCQGRESYRLTWYAAGGRQMKSFPTYAGKGGAKEFADDLVKKLAQNSQATMLSSAQASDALAAIERLNTFQIATGRKITLLAAVTNYCDASTMLGERTITEAATGFLSTSATVKRKILLDAVEEFITGEEPRTRFVNGQRSQLNAKYHYNRAIQLRRFAGTFTGSAVCDLGKHDLDNFFTSKLISGFSPKSRNHYRRAISQFISWCVRKDYLAAVHRLHQADGLRLEQANTAANEIYSPKEFLALLEAADGLVRVMIAIGGFAGLRQSEILQLDWSSVWRTPRHIEVTTVVAKTRKRRLVEVCPALVKLLVPFRDIKVGRLWPDTESVFIKANSGLYLKAGVKHKFNGLRHSFCTYQLASHANENLTAQQSGNSPTVIHTSYKGLATQKQALAWFAVKPAKAARVIDLPQPQGPPHA